MTGKEEKHWILRNIPWIITTSIVLIGSIGGFYIKTTLANHDLAQLRKEFNASEQEKDKTETAQELHLRSNAEFIFQTNDSINVLDRDLFNAEDDIFELSEKVDLLQNNYSEQMSISRQILNILEENN